MAKFFKKYYFVIVPLTVTFIMLLQNIKISQVDDYFVMEMANSFKTNSHSEHLMFINIFYGYLLKFLYNLIPSVNWFGLLYVAVVNAAFIPLNKITQHYENKVIFIGILAVLQVMSFLYITFTIMPFICAVAAILWCLEYVKKIDRHSIKHILFSFFLFFLGFGMRSGSTFICIFLMFIPIYLFSVLDKRNSISAVAIIMGICIIANYSITGMQKAYKKTIPEDMYFNQFQEYRAELSDGAKINYEENKEYLQSIGISKNDLIMFMNWEYADKNVFSNENLEKIVALRSFSDKYTLNIFEFSIKPLVGLVILAFLSIALICFIFFKVRRKEIFLFAFFVLGAMFFLFVRGRAPLRVMLPITISGIITLMYIGMQEFTQSIKLNRIIKNVALTAIIILYVALNSYNVLRIVEDKNISNNVNKVVEYVNTNDDKTYITDEKLRWYIAPHIINLTFENPQSEQPYNIFGDWYVYSYFWYDQLEQLGLSEYKDSTFKAVLEDDIRIVSNQPVMLERIRIFLEENYGIKSKYIMEEKIDNTGYNVYKFNNAD